MPALFSTLAAAFCVWRIVRIVNRRERWPKGDIAVLVSLPLLYAASIGPACWIATRGTPDSPGRTVVLGFYYPVLWMASRMSEPVNRAAVSYTRLYSGDGSSPGLLGDDTPTWYYSPPSAFWADERNRHTNRP
jgi:hypothetical protein